MNYKQIIKLEKKADKMLTKYEDIASKVKPNWKEPIALELMLRMSGYYDLIHVIDNYYNMRYLQQSLKRRIYG